MIAQKAEDFATPLIDRDFFYKNFAGDCDWNTMELDRLFDFCDKSERVLRTDEIAYILATIRHECGMTLLPTREETDIARAPWLAGKYLPYTHGLDFDGHPHPKTGYLYMGRGYTQLTWFSNYDKFEKITGLPLVGNPDLLLVPENAWKVLELGMYDGLYTGKKMSDYFTGQTSNFFKARAIINGVDHAYEIRDYALQFFYVLRYIS